MNINNIGLTAVFACCALYFVTKTIEAIYNIRERILTRKRRRTALYCKKYYCRYNNGYGKCLANKVKIDFSGRCNDGGE